MILDPAAPRVKQRILRMRADAGHRLSRASIAPFDTGAYRTGLCHAANSPLHPRPRSLNLARDAQVRGDN
jgi:hypothetical protein